MRILTLRDARAVIARPAVLRGAIVVILAMLGIGALSLVPIPPAADWQEVFRPAVLKWLSGVSPYTGEHQLFNPPWVLFPLAPFALLPYAIGRAALLVASFAVFAIVAKRFGASPIAMGLFLMAMPTWESYAFGNVEWLVALGLILPRPAGMLLLAVKPQASIAIMAFYAVEAWRASGIRGLIRLGLPLAVVLVLSFVMFGAWPLASLRYLQYRGSVMDYSFFPLSIVPGVVLVLASLRRQDVRYAMAASPCFFPVLTPMSWLFAFLPLVSMPLELAGAVVTVTALLIITLINGKPI